LTDHTRIYNNFINSRRAAGRAVTGVKAVNQYHQDEAEALDRQAVVSDLQEVEDGFVEIEGALELWLDLEEIKEVHEEIQNKPPDRRVLEYFERMLEQDNNLALMLKDIIDRHGAKVLAQRKNKTQDLNSKISRIEVELREKERNGASLKKANKALKADKHRLQHELSDYKNGILANAGLLESHDRALANLETERNRLAELEDEYKTAQDQHTMDKGSWEQSKSVLMDDKKKAQDKEKAYKTQLKDWAEKERDWAKEQNGWVEKERTWKQRETKLQYQIETGETQRKTLSARVGTLDSDALAAAKRQGGEVAVWSTKHAAEVAAKQKAEQEAARLERELQSAEARVQQLGVAKTALQDDLNVANGKVDVVQREVNEKQVELEATKGQLTDEKRNTIGLEEELKQEKLDGETERRRTTAEAQEVQHQLTTAHESAKRERTRADNAEVEVNRVRTELENAKVDAVDQEKARTTEWKVMYNKAETDRKETQKIGHSYLTQYQAEVKKISILERELTLRTAQHQDKVNHVQVLEADVSRLQSEVISKDQSINDQKVTIQRKDTRIENLETQSAAQKSKINELNSNMLNKDQTYQLGSKELDNMKDELRQKIREKELVEKDLEHANDDLASLKKKADQYKEEVNTSRAMAEALKRELEDWARVIVECFSDPSWKFRQPAITYVTEKVTNTFWPIRERDIGIAATNMLDAITKSQDNDISTPEPAGVCALRMWIMAYVCPVELDYNAMQVFLRALTIEASYQRSILGFLEATLEVLLSQDMSTDTVLFVLRGIEMLMLTSTMGPRRLFACQMLEQVKDKVPAIPLWQALENWLTDKSRGINSVVAANYWNSLPMPSTWVRG